MVQIVLQIPGTEPSKCPEWVMLELQGNLESRKEEGLHGKFIGDLHFFKKDDTPILIIGHHILHGKLVKLERPFGVLVKNSIHNESTDSDIPSTDTGDRVDYYVTAIIRTKLLFKTRPKPIIANVPKNL